MYVDIVSAFDELDRLRPDWEAVYDADPESHYFMSWNWMRRYLETRGNWHVLAARPAEGTAYVAFLPLQIRLDFEPGHGFYNAIHMAGMPFSVYSGILSLPEQMSDAMAAFAASLQTFNWRRLNLDEIYLSDERLQALIGSFPRADFVPAKVVRASHITDAGEDIDHDAYVYIPLEDDFENFLSTRLSAKTRRNARWALRDLANGKHGMHITHTTSETFEQNLETFYAMWNAQWGARQPEYAAGIIDGCRKMLRGSLDDGSLFVPVLWEEDRAVAAQILYLDHKKKTMHCFIGGRDSEAQSHSPGFALHCYCLRWGIENGFRVYDFGTGDYAYKFTFGAEQHQVERRRVMTVSERNIGDRLDPRSLDAVCTRASHMAAKGDLENAALCCRQILAADPDHARGRALWANLEAARRRPANASELDTLMQTAVNDHRQGALDRAASGYRRVIEVEPAHFAAHHQLALVLLQQGRFEAAQTEVAEALALRLEDAAAHCTCGNILAALKRDEGALASYDRAIALSPGYATAFNNRGNVLRRMGRLDEAVASYSHALERAPDYAQAALNKAAVLAELHAVEPV